MLQRKLTVFFQTLLCIACILVIALFLVAALQRYYTKLADRFYQQEAINEERLLVMENKQYLLQSEALTPEWHNLLNDTTGSYQQHHYIGWDAELDELTTLMPPIFNLYYNVSYLSAITYEILSFRGLFPPRLILRQVRLGIHPDTNEGGAQKMENALVSH